MGRHSKYPEEFRRETVRLVLTTDKSMAEVARDLGVNYKTLGNWVRTEQAQSARDLAPGALSESERAELKRVKKENAELKIEREILRKAAAYFAKETIR
jgi:transposase